MTPKEYSKFISNNPLFKMTQRMVEKGHVEQDPDDYQRGLEIQQEQTFDDDVDGDDDLETHQKRETLTARDCI